jgi:hypothetical protein
VLLQRAESRSEAVCLCGISAMLAGGFGSIRADQRDLVAGK